MAKAKELPKHALPPTNLKLLETMATSYHAIVPVGHVRENIESRDYWCHVARKLRQHSRIEFVAEDFSFAGTAIVKGCGDTWATIWILNWVDGESGGVTDDILDGFKIDQIGTGFRVIQKATGNVVKDRLPDRKSALGVIEDFAKQ